MTGTVIGQRLETAPLFQRLDKAALAKIASTATVRDAARGEAVVHQGDEAATVLIVLDGRLKVAQTSEDGDQVVIRYIGPGELCGGAAAFAGVPYPATVFAATESRLAAWSTVAFRSLMLEHPGLALNALAILGQRLQVAQDNFRELATERVERRIARALVRLTRAAGRRTENGVLIDFPISRQDIAEMTGATLHTVSRILSGWEQAGWIDGGRQRIVIRRPHAIVSIAEDL